MPSPLSFASTTNFRNALIVKNLSPYSVTGTYSPPSGAINYETVLSNFSVIDSPNNLNVKSPTNYYVINEFGPDGGFNLNMYNIQVLTNAPNQGPYLDSFLPSKYTPYSILLNNNPTGSDGSLSQDSYIAKLGATFLKQTFEDRINFEVYKNTVGVVNLNSLQDPFQAALIATGQQPLIFRNWKITIPENPIVAAADFATRLGGAYWPVSFIPGDYFNENVNNGLPTSQSSGALSTINKLTGGLLGPILNIKRNPSEIFLGNTGNGQKSALFANLYYNKYKPNYESNFGGPIGGIVGLVNSINNVPNPNGTVSSSYYVGSPNSEPAEITSPPNQIPVNNVGQQIPTIVYGPDEMGKLYEGNISTLTFGLGNDGKNIDGQFVWTSPKYKGNAGYHPTVGGGAGSKDTEYNLISSQYQSNESTNFKLKGGSILDSTQQLVNSADNVTGPNRLKHVGNAINQVSKVFNDGYREMTKGSQVVSYSDNTTGAEAGIEYCRVFAKDTPYYTFADLQKTDGITTSGRLFTNSVLDNTYNLNIAPLKGEGSTNIVHGSKWNDEGGYAKKYMFSIENLAWRTSGREGFRVTDLPVCERGPNGGRVMWFPPYDIKFGDSSQANWNPTSFIGRPEPIYTYKETSRSGTLSWKIIVDHPSVLNAIVNNQLKDGSSDRVNSIIESFFAGCVKFDLYTLAAKYNKIPVSELQQIQTALNNPRLTPEELSNLKVSIPADNTSVEGNNANNTGGVTQSSTTPDTSIDEFENKYLSFALYFDNDIPGPHTSTSKTADEDYLASYNKYIDRKSTYSGNSLTVFKADSPEAQTTGFFDNVVISNFNMIAGGDKNFITDAIKLLEAGHGPIKVKMVGSASAVATTEYNKSLSYRRLDSVKKFFSSKGLEKYINDNKFLIVLEEGAGEEISLPITVNEVASGTTTVDTKDFGNIIFNEVNCREDQKPDTSVAPNNSTNRRVAQVYSTSAMACRRVKISEISVTPKSIDDKLVNNVEDKKIPETVVKEVEPLKPQATNDVSQSLKQGLSKKVLRALLSECDYFEMIQEHNPMVYNSFKEKLKYFNPAFHSMTPEGLNSRITFLNQCVRPGDTIPIIGPDGKPKYGDSLNTSFGSAPVLILRIGDFFHTKIIPNNLSFSYEPLVFDMNPEGIGVQPMIVEVSLGFNIIGGMGLKGPVDQLQNALSFNYYANTEVYDERATATEDTSKLDKKVFDEINANSGNNKNDTVNNQQQKNGGETIGQIKTAKTVTGGEEGEILYGTVMDKLLDVSKDYFTNILNQLEKVVLQYNYGTLNMFNSVNTTVDRIYTDGTIGGKMIKNAIYGKPQINKNSTELFDNVKDNIDSDSNPIMAKLKSKFEKDTVNLTIVRQNMKQYIDNMVGSYNTGLEGIIKDIVSQENNMITLISQLNLISTKTDGKLKDGTIPVVYNISGSTTQGDVNSASSGVTNTFEEFTKDYEKLSTNLEKYYTLLIDKKILNVGYDVNKPFTPESNKIGTESVDLTFFMVMARVLSDPNKLNEFKNFVISGPLTSPKNKKLKKLFDNVCDDLSNQYKKELDNEEKLFSDLKKNKEYTKYTTGITEIMYPKGKVRRMYFTTVKNTATETNQETDIKNIYGTVNYGKDANNLDTFDGKINI